MSARAFTFSLAMLTVTVCAVGVIHSRPVPTVVRTNLEKLPMMITGYSATEDFFPEAVYRELNADTHVYRHYRDRSGNQVDLYIGYYGTAKGGRTGHNPYACLPGAGAAIVDTGTAYLRQEATGRTVAVNYILARKGDLNTVMLHWYQTAGRTVASTGLKQNYERFMGRVLYNRNDGAFVRVTATASEADVPKTRRTAEQFAQTVLNLLPDYWPEER